METAEINKEIAKLKSDVVFYDVKIARLKEQAEKFTPGPIHGELCDVFEKRLNATDKIIELIKKKQRACHEL